MWAPLAVRERGWNVSGPAGEMGRRGFVGLGGRKEKRSGPRIKKKRGGKDGPRVDRFGLFFLFFSFFFKSFSNFFSNLFKSNLLHIYHKPFLNYF
jgi:hypothetical protein